MQHSTLLYKHIEISFTKERFESQDIENTASLAHSSRLALIEIIMVIKKHSFASALDWLAFYNTTRQIEIEVFFI